MFRSDILIPACPGLRSRSPLIVYAALLILLRLRARAGPAQPSNLVVLLTISNTVQNAIIGNDNSVLGGLVGALTLLLFNLVVVRFFTGTATSTRSRRDAQSCSRSAAWRSTLDKELITVHETQAHAEVRVAEGRDTCILEPGGTGDAPQAVLGRRGRER